MLAGVTVAAQIMIAIHQAMEQIVNTAPPCHHGDLNVSNLFQRRLEKLCFVIDIFIQRARSTLVSAG